MSIEVISISELVSVVEVLFADIRAGELVEKFKTAIGYDEMVVLNQLQKSKSNYYAYVNAIDVNNAVAVTPSYRQLPSDIHLPPCSGRYVFLKNFLVN